MRRCDGACLVGWFALAAAVVLASAATAGEAAADSLTPRRVIDCRGFAGQPADLEWHAGRIWLVDALERVIWRLDPDGSRRDALEVPGTRPRDLFFACGATHVVDARDRTLRRREADGSWTAFATGHRVFHADGDAMGMTLSGPRDGKRPVATIVDCAGDTVSCGEAYRLPHPLASLTANANYTQVAQGGSLVVIAHRALGHLRVHDRHGRHLTDIQLRDPEAAAVRRWYLGTLGRAVEEPVISARDSLLADLARAAAPGTFPVPIYVSDLVVRDGLIHVVIGNALQVYAPGGELVARFAFSGKEAGERVVVHQICFSEEGSLLGLDMAHYHKIYDFGPLPREAAP